MQNTKSPNSSATSRCTRPLDRVHAVSLTWFTPTGTHYYVCPLSNVCTVSMFLSFSRRSDTSLIKSDYMTEIQQPGSKLFQSQLCEFKCFHRYLVIPPQTVGYKALCSTLISLFVFYVCRQSLTAALE